MKPLTMFQEHLKKWKDCVDCELSNTRKKMVFTKGKIPCDIMFIGEAPGHSENVLGIPFVGPAGQLLDKIVESAVPDGLRIAYTNLVCCIPMNDDGKADAPPKEAIAACKPRLAELIEVAEPSMIVCVGSLPSKNLPHIQPHWLQEGDKLVKVDITHPAAILRGDKTQIGFYVQRSVSVIQTAIYTLLVEKKKLKTKLD